MKSIARRLACPLLFSCPKPASMRLRSARDPTGLFPGCNAGAPDCFISFNRPVCSASNLSSGTGHDGGDRRFRLEQNVKKVRRYDLAEILILSKRARAFQTGFKIRCNSVNFDTHSFVPSVRIISRIFSLEDPEEEAAVACRCLMAANAGLYRERICVHQSVSVWPKGFRAAWQLSTLAHWGPAAGSI